MSNDNKPTAAQIEFVREMMHGVRCPTCGEKHPSDFDFDCEAEKRALISAVFPELRDKSRDNSMTDLKPEDLALLRELAEAATPGPWQNGIDDLEGVVAPHQPGLGNVICIPPLKQMYSSLEKWDDNAAYIAAASPEVILSLLADRALMEKALRAADEALTQFAAFEDEARYIMGNTNFEIVQMRRAEVRQALGASQ